MKEKLTKILKVYTSSQFTYRRDDLKIVERLLFPLRLEIEY